MNFATRIKSALFVMVLSWGCLSFGLGQPRLILSDASATSYKVGDTIDSEVWLLDSEMNKVQLMDQLKAEAKVVVLVIFGGAAAAVPEKEFRGELWCRDSFDDFAIQRAIVNQFQGLPVQIIGISIPPIFSPERYGFSENVFLAEKEDSEAFESAVQIFIEKNEALREKTLIPFHQLLYDPKARMLEDMEDQEVSPGYGEVFDWQGKFKWHEDPRKYGAPTIWILNSEGTVLAEPFWGNDYGSSPPQVNYGFVELRDTIERFLN